MRALTSIHRPTRGRSRLHFSLLAPLQSDHRFAYQGIDLEYVSSTTIVVANRVRISSGRPNLGLRPGEVPLQ